MSVIKPVSANFVHFKTPILLEVWQVHTSIGCSVYLVITHLCQFRRHARKKTAVLRSSTEVEATSSDTHWSENGRVTYCNAVEHCDRRAGTSCHSSRNCFERINLNSNISVTHVHTNHLIADIWTKDAFARYKWNQLIGRLCIISKSFHRSPCSVVAALVPLAH